MAKGNYDNAAMFYDRLAGIVFGNSLIKAQVYLLERIPAESKILIVGGGTGRILEEISKIHPAGLDITYVEISAKMMALSQKRNVGGNRVTFITQAIQKVELDSDFDVVITPFLFDNFLEADLPAIFDSIHNTLKSSGLWLYADFQLTGKLWQNLMLKSMLLFFKILCGVESWRLPDAKGIFVQKGYQVLAEQEFYGRFVVSRVYKKSK